MQFGKFTQSKQGKNTGCFKSHARFYAVSYQKSGVTFETPWMYMNSNQNVYECIWIQIKIYTLSARDNRYKNCQPVFADSFQVEWMFFVTKDIKTHRS